MPSPELAARRAYAAALGRARLLLDRQEDELAAFSDRLDRTAARLRAAGYLRERPRAVVAEEHVTAAASRPPRQRQRPAQTARDAVPLTG